MMPFDIYRLYQVERPKSAREVQRADDQAARFAAAVSWPFLAIRRAVRGPYRAAAGASPLAAPAAACGPCPD
jgi:hypothetical protein